MKKAGPILLVAAIGMIAYLLWRPDPAAADFKTDMLDFVLQGMGQGDERAYMETQVGKHHAIAARACKGATQEEAFKIYMREQFKNLIAQSEKDGRKELARTVQGLAHVTMGPREFPKPAGAPAPAPEPASETTPPAGSEVGSSTPGETTAAQPDPTAAAPSSTPDPSSGTDKAVEKKPETTTGDE